MFLFQAVAKDRTVREHSLNSGIRCQQESTFLAMVGYTGYMHYIEACCFNVFVGCLISAQAITKSIQEEYKVTAFLPISIFSRASRLNLWY